MCPIKASLLISISEIWIWVDDVHVLVLFHNSVVDKGTLRAGEDGAYLAYDK